MDIYIFASKTIENIRRGIEHRLWAVPDIDEPYRTGRRTRASQMPKGSVGLFYSSEPRQKAFTTPFLTDSKPEDRSVSEPWDDIWYLPFKIRPLGELAHRVTWTQAKLRWPFVRDAPNRGGLVAGTRAFAPEFIPRSEWDDILHELGVDPEEFDEIRSESSRQ
jgi:hypothetical protein